MTAPPPDRSHIESQLRELEADLPKARLLTLADRIELIRSLGGPRTVRSIVKASQTLPLKRIPFLFSSLDTQLVMDVLGNDMEEALSHFPPSRRTKR